MESRYNQVRTLKKGDIFDNKEVASVARGAVGSMIEFVDGSAYIIIEDRVMEMEETEEVAWHMAHH